ncbi:MAG: bifunctional (p)ppGpp synthetase/guanosine-3',5'-bis(diphosphate) 3'-pyrophosphohydrolase [Chloroflexi bacterium]|nr:bifunctional (p)ppGpp synthetase/guanosine-3',5'-bis(diphosphate) 3'-pyrophosphohydrolase [Chloroflexota bacterium]
MCGDCVTAEQGYSALYEQALRLSAGVHRPQNRKGCTIPYITHPVHVSLILLRHGFSMDVAVAGLLHDVVEDQGYDIALIKSEFGDRVTEIVIALSERKCDSEGRRRPWEVRKQEGLHQMRTASYEAVAVKVADTLHNVRSTLLDIENQGATVFERFSRGPRQMVTHYGHILEVAQERLGDHSIVIELAEAIHDLAQVARVDLGKANAPE